MLVGTLTVGVGNVVAVEAPAPTTAGSVASPRGLVAAVVAAEGVAAAVGDDPAADAPAGGAGVEHVRSASVVVGPAAVVAAAVPPLPDFAADDPQAVIPMVNASDAPTRTRPGKCTPGGYRSDL